MRLRIAVLALLCASPAIAFEPYLVKDINPLYQSAGSQPDRFASLGNIAVFEATTAEEGRELWASDGTAAGTFLLADVCPGACSANLRGLLATPKGYFFSAGNQFGERELWVTRGTPASTIRLATRLVASREALPVYLESQGAFYFAGNDDGQGLDLWRSDGTPAGTYRVADLPPGGVSFGRPVLFAGRIFFSTHDGTSPSLWVSDGTAAGTRLLKRAWPENGLTPLTGMVPTSRFLYFFAPSTKGLDLWRSDGTSKGTRMVADLNLIARPGQTVLQGLAALGDRLLFVGQADSKGDEVWVSDGTAAGTRKITNFSNPTPFGFDPFFPLGNRLVFVANDGTKGRELWGTDGTAKGTRLVVDVFPGTGSGVSFLSQIYKGRLLFSGTDGRRGQELWTSDGTPQGTRMIRDICRGSCSSSAFPLAPLGDQLLLVADDGRSGKKIWKTNGTAAGTVPVTDLIPEGGFFQQMALPGKVLFTRRDDVHGEELWATDGTAAGTGLVADLNDANRAGSFPSTFMRLGHELFFTANDGQRLGLWKSDGTAAGTTLVHAFDVDPATFPSLGNWWEEAGGILYFSLRFVGEASASLWRTDGTDAGTFRLDFGPLEAGEVRTASGKLFLVLQDEDSIYSLGVSDGTPEGIQILTNSDWYAPRELTASQDKLFFFAGDSLWVSDGTIAGTVELREFERQIGNLTVHQGFVYFYADGDTFPDRALWRSDGTVAGTVKAADLPPRFDVVQPIYVTSSGSLLFLWNLTVEGQEGLWVSDGTTDGTRWVSPVHLLQAVFVPPVVLDGAVYFFGREGGLETLWRSDGTQAGTYPVLDEEGPGFWLSSPIAVSGGLLFFAQSAADVPLWRSDGTAAGSSMIRELAPDSGNTLSEGSPFAIGPRVFFQAYDPATGYELWAIDTRED